MILQITTTAQDGTVTLVATGEIDMTSAPQLRQALADAPAGARLVLDLSGVGFLDSAGIRVLYDYLDRSPELVVAPDAAISRILGLTGLRDQLTVREKAG